MYCPVTGQYSELAFSARYGSKSKSMGPLKCHLINIAPDSNDLDMNSRNLVPKTRNWAKRCVVSFWIDKNDAYHQSSRFQPATGQIEFPRALRVSFDFRAPDNYSELDFNWRRWPSNIQDDKNCKMVRCQLLKSPKWHLAVGRARIFNP